MDYIAVLRDRSNGTVLDIAFADKESFDSWYDEEMKKSDEILAEGIKPDEVFKYTNSSEAVKSARDLLTPDLIS